MTILTFKPDLVTKNLLSAINKARTQDIIRQRYGLNGLEKKKTLEAIGQQYGITRERIRQIENFAISAIKQSPSFASHQDAFSELKNIIIQKGKTLSEREVLDYLSDDPKFKNHIFFLLVLGDDFTKLKEDEEFHHRWTIDKNEAEKVHEILRRLHQDIKEEDAMPEQEMISAAKKHAKSIIEEEIQDEIIRSWLNISKIVARNSLGEWGLSKSPNIRPRGIRDLAFLVLRKQGSPMHFTEVSKKIIDYFKKSAHPATVHNELIKDDRFVLVGRGLYALKDWGYKTGTVRDIIKKILKESGPLSREEIIKQILKERYVKENTILVNLQNRNYFKKNKEGKYVIA